MKCTEIYLVYGELGEYSDYVRWEIAAFEDSNEAEKAVETLRDQMALYLTCRQIMSEKIISAERVGYLRTAGNVAGSAMFNSSLCPDWLSMDGGTNYSVRRIPFNSFQDEDQAEAQKRKEDGVASLLRAVDQFGLMFDPEQVL